MPSARLLENTDLFVEYVRITLIHQFSNQGSILLLSHTNPISPWLSLLNTVFNELIEWSQMNIMLMETSNG